MRNFIYKLSHNNIGDFERFYDFEILLIVKLHYWIDNSTFDDKCNVLTFSLNNKINSIHVAKLIKLASKVIRF